ncbi:hypothetical protein RRG08_063794 [Elysia crispata]|uniref:Uncharacterized protein n=1 Tax=Elysia crispata TaxID=231223 RepID=A0AAE1AJG4_9GAST|nr:hypothetical protein RRG08_063794 [Elysia crispata]
MRTINFQHYRILSALWNYVALNKSAVGLVKPSGSNLKPSQSGCMRAINLAELTQVPAGVIRLVNTSQDCT